MIVQRKAMHSITQYEMDHMSLNEALAYPITMKEPHTSVAVKDQKVIELLSVLDTLYACEDVVHVTMSRA